MEFRQLEAFKLISDNGSFSETAKLMGITQPTVSAQISSLEREFGGELLLRQPGKAVSSEAGVALYKYAVEILELKNRAITACGRHQDMGGNIAMAASSIPYQFVLPVLSAQFAMKHPDVTFTLTGGNSAGVIDLILSGDADLGMVGSVFPNENLSYEAILEDELVAVTPACAPYTGWDKSRAELADILSSPFAAREEGSGTWAELTHYLERHG
jgi:DNA-binding transcriptional LysR family regulator